MRTLVAWRPGLDAPLRVPLPTIVTDTPMITLSVDTIERVSALTGMQH